MKLARKSATPIKINEGASATLNPPVVRNLIAIAIVNSAVVARIVTIVINALESEPIPIRVNAVPKPKAAPKAKATGFNGKPCEISGPLAQKAPASAMTTPIQRPRESCSPPINANITGTTAPSELIGETTPMRPVLRPTYKQINPIYPSTPANTPGQKKPEKNPSFPKATAPLSSVAKIKKIPKAKPINWVIPRTAKALYFLLIRPA